MFTGLCASEGSKLPEGRMVGGIRIELMTSSVSTNLKTNKKRHLVALFALLSLVTIPYSRVLQGTLGVCQLPHALTTCGCAALQLPWQRLAVSLHHAQRGPTSELTDDCW